MSLNDRIVITAVMGALLLLILVVIWETAVHR